MYYSCCTSLLNFLPDIFYATVVSSFSSKMPEKIEPFRPKSTPIKDCLSCRIIGTATFSGICGYSTYTLYSIPKSSGIGHRVFLGSLIVFSGYMAVYRALSK